MEYEYVFTLQHGPPALTCLPWPGTTCPSLHGSHSGPSTCLCTHWLSNHRDFAHAVHSIRETLTFFSSSYPLQFKCPILRRLSGPVGPFVKYVMGQHIPPGSHCPTGYFIVIYLLLPLGCKFHRHRDNMALIAFLPSTEPGTE